MDVQSLQASHSQELSALRVAHVETIALMKTRHEEEQSKASAASEAALQVATSKVVRLEASLQSLQSEHVASVSSLREVTRELQQLSAKHDDLRASTDIEVAERRAAESKARELEKCLLQMHSKCDALGQQVRDKEEIVTQTMALHRSAEESRKLSDEKLALYAATIESYQKKLEQGVGEMERGNAVIGRLGEENKGLKERLKVKSEVLRRQVSALCYAMLCRVWCNAA